MKYEQERDTVMGEALEAKVDAKKKRQDIDAIKQTIVAFDAKHEKLNASLQKNLAKKEEMSVVYRGFFKKQEDM